MHHGTKQTFAIDNRLLPALRHVLTRRMLMLAVFAGGKWFGKKGCSLNGALYVRPGGTSKNIIRAGDGKTRIDGSFPGDQFSNHEDVDVDVLLVSKM